jgi:hypothetical protein
MPLMSASVIDLRKSSGIIKIEMERATNPTKAEMNSHFRLAAAGAKKPLTTFTTIAVSTPSKKSTILNILPPDSESAGTDHFLVGPPQSR